MSAAPQVPVQSQPLTCTCRHEHNTLAFLSAAGLMLYCRRCRTQNLLVWRLLVRLVIQALPERHEARPLLRQALQVLPYPNNSEPSDCLLHLLDNSCEPSVD